MKSENKEVRYELAENLENLKEQAKRLQNCIAENGILKKYFVITKQKVESWKLIKQKKKKKKMNMILHSYWNWKISESKLNFLKMKNYCWKNNRKILKTIKFIFKKWPIQQQHMCCIPRINQLAGVSANKTDKVVDIALTQIAGIQGDWLPKSTFAKASGAEASTTLPQSS